MAEQAEQPTPEQLQAIETARAMATAGIPIFVCPPNPYRPGKYFFKADWQHTVADPAALDAWRPGWGVAAVGGGAADFLDIDPRSGGDESQLLLKNEGAWPLTFGTQSTPSGGTHHIISRTGERKETGFLPGVDFQAGADEPDESGSHGRAFVWLAPTVGVSKVTGELVPYRWVSPPDLEALDEWRAPDGSSSDASVEGIVARVHAHRALKRTSAASLSSMNASSPHMAAPQSQLFGGSQEVLTRAFTMEEAQAFTAPALQALREAPIGQIEERGMAATLALEHFVPSHLTADQAFNIITDALSATAYDPNGPSDWTADKFKARLDGRRPVVGSWKAELREAPAFAAVSAAVAEPAEDAVEALLAEMLTPAQMKAQPGKPYLIKTLLTLRSTAWIIGAPGSRKSFVALDMAAHIAAGRDWQGLKVRQGPVVIIAAEGAPGMGGRITAWEAQYGPMPENVHILPRPVQAANAGAWAVLVKACERLAPVMVIADTQARITVGLEENSATDMGLFVNAVSAIERATGACVVPIHHTGRNGGDARGSSALDGAQDTELKVVADGKPLRGELRVEKQKDLPEREPIKLAFKIHRVGTDEDGDPITSLALLPPDAWTDAEVDPKQLEPGQEVEISEPGAWTLELVPHPRQITERRILQVMRDIFADGQGRTEADIQRVIRDRWFEGRPMKAKRTGHLDSSTWAKAWPNVQTTTGQGGEPLLVNVAGQRWSINPAALPAEAGL